MLHATEFTLPAPFGTALIISDIVAGAAVAGSDGDHATANDNDGVGDGGNNRRVMSQQLKRHRLFSPLIFLLYHADTEAETE